MSDLHCMSCHEWFGDSRVPGNVRARTNHERRCVRAKPWERIIYRKTGSWPRRKKRR